MARPGKVTTDHDFIRRWASERGAHPAAVKRTETQREAGIIRLDFPGYSGTESLEPISWDEFFQKFDQKELALLYQDTSSDGKPSNFNKLVSRHSVAKS